MGESLNNLNKNVICTPAVCLLFLIFFVLLNSVHGQKPLSKAKPNILWLVTEDISPYLSSYGDSTAKTPNLDRLAKEGIVYKNVFDVSGVCAPSRSSLITGMYPTCYKSSITKEL